MHKVTVEKLDASVEFDVPFRLDPDVEWNADLVSTYSVRAWFKCSLDYPAGHDMEYAPTVHVPAYVDAHGDAHVTGDAYMDGSGWSFFSSGYTGQSGVKRNDPVMHPSELLSGKLARDMITEGGLFVVTTAHMDVGDDYEDDDIVGWVVLRKDED